MTDPLLDREVRRRLAVLRHVEEVTGNVAMTCRYFGISRQLYYTWLRRYRADGPEGLRDPVHCSCRSHNCFHGTVDAVYDDAPEYERGPCPGASFNYRPAALGVVDVGPATAAVRLRCGRARAAKMARRIAQASRLW